MARLYERVAAHGASGLSDAELIQVLLRSGNGQVPIQATVAAILTQWPALNGLAQATVPDLLALSGIGLSKAVGLVAGVEFGQRVWTQTTLRYGTVVSVQALAAHLMQRLRGQTREVMLTLYLDTKLQVIQEATTALGGLDAATADPRVVFAEALRQNASCLILAHNHPSGDPTPSQADKAVTKRFIQAGQLLGISVYDHLVIGNNQYYSFADHLEDLNFFK
ncbi:DNA repair protein RadC [Lacticaseibacillus baoqingensis]|uniref:DNA repair protein RadC n=1 Tax=Lacticaseibacillus baoqingensis TaxID=2486013 RepID=A0ABW4E3K5_9LACO|nr:DNA repair protein RadC [Lacticaseibacillus baoqingensis]